MFRVGKCLSPQNRPGDRRPSLNLNFQGGSLDSRVTFSRTSNATLTGSDGLIQYAPHNLLTYSEQFDNAAWTKSNATVTANAIVAPDGTTTADKFVEAATLSNHEISRNVTVATSTAHVMSVYAKAGERNYILLAAYDTQTNSAFFNLSNGTIGTIAGGATAAISAVGNGWYRCSISRTTTATTLSPYVRTSIDGTGTSYLGDGTSGIYIWGAQLNAGSLQPYYPTTTAAYYGPRFDYDPITLACKGLLIEEQRVNLLTYSEDFSNASWTKAATTVTANSVIAPDGTLTADTLIESATLAQHAAFQTKTLTAAAHTFTVYAKKSTGPQRWLTLYPQGTGVSAIATYNVNTGSVFSSSGAQLLGTSITDVGNGWYRCSIIFTGAAVSVTNVIYLTNNSADPAPSYTGDGTSGIYIWGAQLEAGAFATSYIPTVASQVTRTADNASMTGTNFSSWYNASEGTFNVFADAFSTAPAILGDQSGASAIIYSNASDSKTFNGSVGLTTANTFVKNVLFKTAFSYSSTGRAIILNAGTIASDANLVQTITKVDLGRAFLASYLNGHIQNISYYPRRLTNAELQAITA